MKEWKMCKIGEVVDLQQGLCINSKSNHLLESTGIPLLRITDLINNTEKQFINRYKVNPKFISKKSDLIYTRTGQVGLIFKNRIGVIHNNCFKIIPNEEIDYLFLYYYLKQKSVYEHANNIAGGAAQPDIGHNAFKSIPFYYPCLATQHKIATVLSAYDDLIENHSRRVQILEEMARMIYQEWFVKFRFPGYEKTNFVESPLGMIPKGWRVVEMGQIIDVKHGYAFKGEFFSEEPTNNVLLTPGNFHIGGGFKTDKLKYYNGFVPNEYIFKDGDFIVTMTDLSKLGDTLGYPALIPPSKKCNFLHNQRLGKIIFINEKVGKNFLYYVFCSESYRHHILATATGTTVKHTAPERIKAFKTVLPLSEITNKFETLVGLIRSQICCLNQKNQILEQTRDLLLPKLISGKIDVSDLDIQM